MTNQTVLFSRVNPSKPIEDSYQVNIRLKPFQYQLLLKSHYPIRLILIYRTNKIFFNCLFTFSMEKIFYLNKLNFEKWRKMIYSFFLKIQFENLIKYCLQSFIYFHEWTTFLSDKTFTFQEDQILQLNKEFLRND